jgi:hypothetical protein
MAGSGPDEEFLVYASQGRCSKESSEAKNEHRRIQEGRIEALFIART